MASKMIVPKAKNKLLATLVTENRQPCAFCKREVDDEATYGKLYAIGDIQVHYFCALLSCCLVQKGRDSEGLFGFLYHDIIAEVERSKKHKCSYCNTGGASLGCSKSQCRKQFHLPCGREKHAVSLFYGNYKSFCQLHAPKQKIPDHIMAQAKLRLKKDRGTLKAQSSSNLKVLCPGTSGNDGDTASVAETVCVICYEAVQGYPSPDTFWPPCCARDAWFHRSCLQRMALSAGMHYLKCPLCNDKDQFYSSVVSQGLYVPDRDAAWELEQDAFAGIYERPSTCSAEQCLCERGRKHTETNGEWEMQLCLLCGTSGSHAGCAGAAFVCSVCRTCAPGDLRALQDRIQAVIDLEERQNRVRARRPVMPSRMSLRRTKNLAGKPSTSQIVMTQVETSESDHRETNSVSDETASARLELNLRPPRRPHPTPQQHLVLKTIENTMFSPTKIVEEGLNKKMLGLGVKYINSDMVITKVKNKLAKPRPLCVKKKIVNSVLDKILLDILKDTEEPKQWHSKKTCDTEESPRKFTTVDENKETDCKEAGAEAVEDKVSTEADGYLKAEDDSSNSTFQLPSEFIADHNSDDSLPLFETPKKLTTVDIQKDSSLEISENNEVVNINVVKIKENSDSKEFIKNLKLKIPTKTEKCAFKFNPSDKESLVENNLNMDVESFKNFYLNEVDREKEFQCTFNHKHTEESCKTTKIRTAIDFAVDATKAKEEKRKTLKRKLKSKDGVAKKRPKKDKAIVLHYKEANSGNIKVVCSNDSENSESIDLTVNDPKTEKNTQKKKKKKKNKKRKGQVTSTIDLTVETAKNKKRLKKMKKNKKHRQNIQVKIRFREEQVRLKITKSKTKDIKKEKSLKNKKVKDVPKKLTQCILQYGDKYSPNKVIVKPEHSVTPRIRNYVKLEKSPDALFQTSIQSFFKKIPSSV